MVVVVLAVRGVAAVVGETMTEFFVPFFAIGYKKISGLLLCTCVYVSMYVSMNKLFM